MLPNQAQPKPGVRKALGVKGSVPKGGLKRRLSVSCEMLRVSHKIQSIGVVKFQYLLGVGFCER